MTGPRGEIDVEQWLAQRQPAPPEPLARQLAQIVAGSTCSDPDELSARLLTHAESLIRGLENDRSGAPALLAADALITYAIEAAADDCSSLDRIARAALDRISRVASRGAI